MGLLADLYVSSDVEAVTYDAKPGEFRERAQYKGISLVELSTLWAIVRDIEWDVVSIEEFACVLQEGGGERLIHKLPSEMVQDLATLSREQIADVTAKWAETDELGWALDETRPVVDDLVRLARRALETGWNVYVWNCV